MISLVAIPTLQASMTTIMVSSKQSVQLTTKTRNRPKQSQSGPKSSSKQKRKTKRTSKIRVTSKLLQLVDLKLLRTRETRGATMTTVLR